MKLYVSSTCDIVIAPVINILPLSKTAIVIFLTPSLTFDFDLTFLIS